MDFIKQYPTISIDDYFWKYSAPMIRLMSSDGTYTKYLSENQAKRYWAEHRQTKMYENVDDFMTDLGMPTK